ncbi:hypothetical protein MMC10_000136 [Thelotrema lepadinum]|nr:hypothetical protein [Thelotrema lepadinum]
MSATSTPTNPAEASAAAIAMYMATAMSAPLPPGQTINTVDPPSQQPAIIGVCVVMYVLTALFVGLRLWSSFIVTKSHGWEDYTVIMATLLSFAYMGFILNLSYVQLHMWDVPIRWFSELYWEVNTLHLILTVRDDLTRPSSDFIVYLCNVPLLAIFCAPSPGGSWASIFGNCQRLEPLAVAQGSCNVALDIYILALPIRSILNLQLPTRKRIGILVVFSTGLFALLASAISLYYRYELTYGPDTNWNEGAFVASAAVEINVAIICSSMPGCSSFAKHYIEKKGSFGSSLASFFRFGKSSKTGSTSGAYSKKSGISSENRPDYRGWSREVKVSAGSSEAINHHDYMELQENAHSQQNDYTNIRRTVEIEVV